MSVQLNNSSDPTVTKIVTSDENTIVTRVVVGTPIRRVSGSSSGVSVDNISGINTSGKTDGSVLVYSSSSGDFESTTTLEKQNVDGGSY